MLFEFKRLQFSVRLEFAMTIGKAHGQSLLVVGTKFGKSILPMWTAVCGLLTRRKILFIRVYIRREKILCIQKHLNKQN